MLIGGKMIPGTINPTYKELLNEFVPRPIKSTADYFATQEEVDRLLDKSDLSPDEQDYLDLLGTLIMDYEERTEDESDYELHGIELIKGLIELHALKQKDLVPIFKTKSIVSAVLNGKRQLTTDHINKLSAFFHVPHGLFFEPISDEW
jgi:HTH-type transcriptional regulator/antitoxin HigA